MERSPARQELEAKLRSLLPVPSGSGGRADETSKAAAAGVGGALAGYVWGWFRGRRARKK